MTKVTNNPELYRALSRPFASEAEANEQLQRFQAAVSAARIEYSVADVYVICRVTSKMPDGDILPGISMFRFGDHANSVPMLLYAFGVASDEYDAFLRAHFAAGEAQAAVNQAAGVGEDEEE